MVGGIPTPLVSWDYYSQYINGHSRISKWRYVSTIFLAIKIGGKSPYMAVYMVGTSILGS